ncbi:MAG: hypothetical protein WCV41_03915 [Patescibacteria group bacterium]
MKTNRNQAVNFTIAMISALVILIGAQIGWCQGRDVTSITKSDPIVRENNNAWDDALASQLDKARGYQDVVVIHLGINDRQNEAYKISELYSQGLGRPVIALPSYLGDPKTDIIKASEQYLNKNNHPLNITDSWEKIIADGHNIVGEIFFSGSGIRANTERSEIISFIKDNPGKVTGNMVFVDTDLKGLTKKDFEKVGINCVQTGSVGAVPWVTKPAQEYVPLGEYLGPVGTALGAVPKAIMSAPAVVDTVRGWPDHSLSVRYNAIIEKLDLPKVSDIYISPPAYVPLVEKIYIAPMFESFITSEETYRLLSPSGQPNTYSYEQIYSLPSDQSFYKPEEEQNYRLLSPSGQPNSYSYEQLYPTFDSYQSQRDLVPQMQQIQQFQY